MNPWSRHYVGDRRWQRRWPVWLISLLVLGVIITGCPRSVPPAVTSSSQAPATLTSDYLFPIGERGAPEQALLSSWRYGYINQIGAVAIAPQFSRAESFAEGLALVSLPAASMATDTATAEAKFGYIDRTGTLVIPAQFDFGRPFAEGLAAVQVGPQWGYIDPTGAWVIPPQYDGPEEFIQNFADGLAGAWMETAEGWQMGYIDRTGAWVIPAQYEGGSPFAAGVAVVQAQGQLGVIDRTGQWLVPPQFSSATTFPTPLTEGLIPVPLVAEAMRLEQGRLVTTGGEWGYIDAAGTVVIPAQFQAATAFSSGLAAVLVEGERDFNRTIGGQWGYIDPTGQWVIPPQFDRALPFTASGLAVVTQGSRCGYIDRTGAIVIPVQYEGLSCGPFIEGLAAIQSAGQPPTRYIDVTGRVVWPPSP